MFVDVNGLTAKHDASTPHLRENKINTKINYIISAGVIAIAATTLMFTLHTYSQAQSAMEQVGNLTHDLAQQRLIQLSQAAYEEQRINTLSERLDNTTNRLESRVQILEARRQTTTQ